MDIYQRICKKEGLQNFDDLNESVSEILDAECSEEVGEEQELSQEEEKLDLNVVQASLKCMKRWIQQLQLRLKIELNECPPTYECPDNEIELTCSENKDLCALQKGHHKLQCQINELIRCCKCAKEQINDLHEGLCQKNTEIGKLQEDVVTLNSWKSTLPHEFSVCIERFEYLKHVKAEWKDVEQMMDEHKKCFEVLKDTYVTKECFGKTQSQASCEMMTLKELIHDLVKRLTQEKTCSDGGDSICCEPLLTTWTAASNHDYMDENN